MTIDMSQFYQVFFEEAQEHLGNMEQLLLEIDPSDPDPEELNAIFRAAHSIKGSAGTFSFQDIAEVTHVLETLLDRVRKNEMKMTDDMVDALLESGDILKNLVEAHQGRAVADHEAASRVCKRVEALMVGPEAADATVPQTEAGVLSSSRTYCVKFMPVTELETHDTVMRNLLAEIGRLGRVDVVEQGKPGEAWRLRVTTEVSRETLVGVIDFIAASGSIVIEVEKQASAAAPVSVAVEGQDFGFFETEEPATQATPEKADGSWGLFEAPAKVQDADDGSFGFFEPLAVVDASKHVAVTPIAAPVATSAAATQARVASPKPAAAAAADKSSIRVNVDKVDQIVNLVGELVITQAMLTAAAEKVDPVVFERLLTGLAQLERNTRDLQESVMSIRMMPISVVFSRFPRVVRDLSGKLGKSVELKLAGESTELDRTLIERISDPLTHLVRNSLDHGIEMPEARTAAGKQATGTINLKASHQSGNIVIEVSDDGGGLNRDKILAKARERGLAVHDNMTDNEVWQLIFEPGFSTAEQVTEVSGRGVGMDVVRRNIAEMGGRVDIESMTGVGTRITVRLPLTLAILDGMSVGVGNETYIIPLNYVVESFQPTAGQIRTIQGSDKLIQVRGDYLPVLSLYETFNCRNAEKSFERGIMIVLEVDGVKTGLFVDALLGQHQVVVKSLDANYRRVPGISGATIMGDGRVALILDAPSLIAMKRAPATLAA